MVATTMIWLLARASSCNKLDGVPFKTRKDIEWCFPSGKRDEVVEQRLQRHWYHYTSCVLILYS